MTGAAATDRNLTGIWNGLFSYRDGASTPFVATLIEGAGSVTGTTHNEPSRLELGVTLCATIVGGRSGNVIAFTKRYDPARPHYDHAVHYKGTLNGDATEIEGRWTISPALFGRFIMTRPARAAAETSRKSVERV